jgi:hypothetical protein
MDITGRWLNVRQGSSQAMGSQRNSRCGAEKKRITKVNKWGRGMHWFWVEVFREGGLDFCALIEV